MRNPFKKYRIDHLFFGCFALLIVVVLSATVWTSYRLTSKEFVATASVNQQQLLSELNNEISTRLLMIEQISLSKSIDSALISLLDPNGEEDEFARYQRFKEVKQSLANLTNSIPLIQGIDVFMGRPRYGDSESYIQFREIGEASEQHWSSIVRRNDYAWSDEYTRHTLQGDVNVLSFVRKVMYNNKLLGYLVIHIKSDTIKEVMAGHSDQSASRMMLDASGRPILHIGEVPDSGAWPEWNARMKDNSGVFRIGNHQGKLDSLLVYSRSANFDWTMVELTPWNQITGGSVKLAKAIAVIGTAAILLSIILTMLLSRQFTKPIKRLVRAMKRYPVEGEDARLPADYENEFGYLFSEYRKLNERIEELLLSLRERHEQQRRAEIEALQANINPHFLYNTLDQLNWMAIAGGQGEMSRILELMGRMFRIGLSNGNSFITVRQEIEHMSCYLEIQQIRHGGKLDYEWDAPEELRGRYLPKMILQPFVENAVLHGFHNREGGTIRIRLRERDARLTIEVEDDGVGIRDDRETAAPARRKTGGYGIRNVRERIAAYFGEEYGVGIGPRDGGGTRVFITLPLLEAPPEAKREFG